ncbi:MAG: hypothetical protein RI894_859 [Bacteroidota bacterium]
MLKKNVHYLAAIVFIALAVTGCRPDDNNGPISVSTPASAFDGQAPYRWNELFLEIDRYSPGYRPPAASRMLGYTYLAVYEAVAPGMISYRPIAKRVYGLNIPDAQANYQYYWPEAANAAYGYMFRKFYPNVDQVYKDKIDQLEASFETSFTTAGVDAAVIERSRNFGRAIAGVVFDWSATDPQGHEAYLRTNPADYTPPVGPGLWKPTAPDFSRALFPYWGQTRAFAVRSADKVGLAPLPYSTSSESAYYQQQLEVATINSPLSYENKWIAEFWGDDIFRLTFEPSGRWVAIADEIIVAKRTNLETSVYLFAKLGMAMSDGAICAWNTKYYYNTERPYDYIRSNINPNWTSQLLTLHNCNNPPFPGYPSGHATFGAAAAGVLNSIYGKNTSFTDKCHQARTEFNGAPRTFRNFDAAAKENAFSRIPLGVHIRQDADEGLRLGYLAAQRVNSLPWTR